MKKKIDLSTWDRKEHFLFFHQFEEPFHGVCVTVDVTKTYQKCKEQYEKKINEKEINEIIEKELSQ